MTVSELSQAEKIEYYLGKDSFKDIYFKPEFPHAYEIPTTSQTKENTTSTTQYFNKRWKPELKFRMNNLGYRCDKDFSVETLRGKKLILCFGCTDTVGMHDELENLWPHLLSTKIDETYEVLNLGIIGASRDTIARVFTSISGVLSDEIKYVCILWPHPNRREIVSKEFTRIVCSHDKLMIPHDEYWDFIDWKSNNYNMLKNKHLVKNICNFNNIKLLDLELERFDKKVPYDYNGEFFALGPMTHQALASYFAKMINGEQSLFHQIKNDN